MLTSEKIPLFRALLARFVSDYCQRRDIKMISSGKLISFRVTPGFADHGQASVQTGYRSLTV